MGTPAGQRPAGTPAGQVGLNGPGLGEWRPGRRRASPPTGGEAEPAAGAGLIEIAERVPRATLCSETALERHGLIDAIPSVIDIAIPRGSTRPSLKAPSRIHQFEPRTFDLGRDELEVGARRPLGLYSAERPLIDVVRLRHLEGSEVAWEALRRWLDRPGRSPAQLIELALEFRRAEPALRQAMEILL